MINGYIESTIIFLIDFIPMGMLGTWALIYYREKYHLDSKRYEQFIRNLAFPLRLYGPLFVLLTLTENPSGRVEARTANIIRVIWCAFCSITPFATPDGAKILSLIYLLLQILAVVWMFRLGRHLDRVER
jgi:hypothetical protein